MGNTIEDDRAIFEDSVRSFTALAAILVIQIDDMDRAQSFKDDFKKRFDWMVECGQKYESNPNYQSPRQ